MAYDSGRINVTLKASADLSGHQFRFVQLGLDGRAAPMTGITQIPFGVLQNKPAAAGERATVCVFGITQLEVGATVVAIADSIATTTNGRAQKSVFTQWASGTALQAVAAGNAGKRIAALVDCTSPVKAP